MYIVQEASPEITAVEIGEAQKGLLFVLGHMLLHHSSHLHQVHLHSAGQDDESKIIHPSLFKLALLWL